MIFFIMKRHTEQPHMSLEAGSVTRDDIGDTIEPAKLRELGEGILREYLKNVLNVNDQYGEYFILPQPYVYVQKVFPAVTIEPIISAAAQQPQPVKQNPGVDAA